MAEYIAIMVINNKTADQINAELSDLIGPEYDPDFSKWLFNAAKGSPSIPPQPSVAPSKPSRLVSQALDAVSNASIGLKRTSSPTREGGPNKARKLDAPSAPRAMRDNEAEPSPTSPATTVNGVEGNSKSLLQRIETFDSRAETRTDYSHRVDRGGRNFRDRDRNDRPFYRQNRDQNQPQNQLQPQNFLDPTAAAAAFGMMDPSMLMGMNMQMNPMALQEIIGNNMAMMQQMANMMMSMHQQHQQPQQPQQSIQSDTGQNGVGATQRKPPGGTAASTPLSADATPFQPTIFVHDKPASTSICKHGVKCNNARCRDSHPSPVATAESGVVLSTEVCDKGPGGSECKDPDCTKSHISPAATMSGIKVQFISATTGKPSRESDKLAASASTTTVIPSFPSTATPSTKSSAPATSMPLNQVPVPCKFGAHCTRPGCHFLHPGRRNATTSSTTPCRFGAKCTRADCSFSHPPGRTLPNQFHKGLSPSTRPSEAFQPAPHRTMVFNVPKKRGENGAGSEVNKENKENGVGDGKKIDNTVGEKEVKGVA